MILLPAAYCVIDWMGGSSALPGLSGVSWEDFISCKDLFLGVQICVVDLHWNGGGVLFGPALLADCFLMPWPTCLLSLKRPPCNSPLCLAQFTFRFGLYYRRPAGGLSICNQLTLFACLLSGTWFSVPEKSAPRLLDSGCGSCGVLFYEPLHLYFLKYYKTVPVGERLGHLFCCMG